MMRRHAESLANVFSLCAKIRQGGAAAASELRGSLDLELAACRQAIDERIPATASASMGIVDAFLARRDWLASEELRLLWAGYVRAGLVRPNKLVRAKAGASQLDHDPPDEMLPLEAAVICDNVDAFAALLDAGADLSQVPSRDWRRTRDTRQIERPIDDLHSFIEAKVGNSNMAPVFAAHAARHWMEQTLAPALPATTQSPVRPTRRHGI